MGFWYRKPKESIPVKTQQYWDEKHPKADQLYDGRPLPGGGSFSMDVRQFIAPRDCQLSQIIANSHLTGDTLDSTALRCQQYVVGNLKYVADDRLGHSEYWLYPCETIALKRGDCEDGAILIASLLMNALPPAEHWRVRVAAGWVQASPTAPQGGHGYVTYCRTTDNEWVVLDWCYLEDSNVHVEDKPLHKNNAPYKDVWFSFNHLFAYRHTDLKLSGRLRCRS